MIESVAVVTTEANADIASIHHRMPVILTQKDYLTWLEANRVSVEEAKALIKPPPDGTMVPRAVGNQVNKVVNDEPSNLNPPDPNEPAPGAPSKPTDPRQGDLF